MTIHRSVPLLLCLALSLPALSRGQEAEVKAIAKAYAAAEAQMKDYSHFGWIAEDVTEEFTHHYEVWRDLEGHPVKVTDDLERITSRELTEYFFTGGKLSFVFTRAEENADGGGGTVKESRCYIAGGSIIQKQTKTAKFKEGQKRDTSAAKSVSAEPGADDDPAAWEARALKLFAALQAGPPVEDGAAPAHEPEQAAPDKAAPGIPDGPASKFCKVIEGSASPNGRYALAWGLQEPGKPARISEEDADQDTEGVVNYIVDTKADAILAVTAGQHFGAKASYNHWEHHALWSADSTLLIQSVDMKWATLTCEAFKIEGSHATRLTNLIEDVQTAVEAKIAKTHAKAWKEQGDHTTFTLSELKLGKGGALTLTAYHQIPKGEGGFTSAVSGKFREDGKFEAAQITTTTD